MFRRLLACALLCCVPASVAFAQDIRRGKVKSLDIEQRQIVITAEGKDHELMLTDETRVLEATGQTLAERLQGISAGTEIMFVAPIDSRELRAIKRVQPADRPRADAGDHRGIVRKVDSERRVITLSVGNEERELTLNDQSQIRGVEGKNLAEQLKALTAGTPLLFRVRKDDGKDILIGAMVARGRPDSSAPRKMADTSALKPLSELTTEKYQGFEGGLYPHAKNTRPDDHEAAGLAIAKKVVPLNKEGKPDPNGQIVLLSIGMSNTSQSSQGFSRALSQAEYKNPKLVFVNGAQGGMTAAAIQSAEGGRGEQYWTTVDKMLQNAGVTREQVQAVWIKQADAGPTSGFPDYAKTLQAELTRIVQLIAVRFPNCRLAYLSSRTYGGFATTNLNPEPYAYESGFAVKWLIERQLAGDDELNFDPAKGKVRAPWLSWGPYLWANGKTPRSDGFFYEVSDFGNDGTHQSSSGQQKVGNLLLDFFHDDSTTRSWFNAAK
jgi:hypothetical protein